MSLTLLDGSSTTTVPAEGLLLDAEALQAATGWELKPQGLCRGDTCVPASLAAPVSLVEVARLLGRPLVHHAVPDGAVAVLGEPAGVTLEPGSPAPPLTLQDVDGRPVEITSPGTKTAVVAWSTWCGCRYELLAWKQLADELRDEGLRVVTVALDDEPEGVRRWTQEGLPTAVDPEHRLSDLFGVVNVPATVWLDEQGRVAKPPTIAPGDDRWKEWTQVDAAEHHDALRRWVRTGELPAVPGPVKDDEALRTARAERRLAAWLHRNGHPEAAEEHFAAAVALAPLDFSIRRASMPLRGQDPFGTEFFALWEEWDAAGRPGYTPTTQPSS
ncbi:MAG TPA: TlpA disulfide reductase family protein [Mycobacteriales bacterium]|nr:TlpA disulfide reductase family protein [Mycobacteriales bacterium]